MICIDFRQIANVTFHSGIKYNGYDVDKFKHQFLNYLLFFKTRYSKFGELVICLDSNNYWRKSIFRYYKGARKKMRDKSEVDFEQVYKMFDELTDDLKNHFPWKVVGVDRAEADDIIAVLTTKFHLSEKIMIISSDKDFLQLQQYPNVYQYSPITKKELVESNPQVALREKIIRGDVGDGIPNCKTRDDIFMSDGKSISITKSWIEPLLRSPNIDNLLTEDEKIKFNRNSLLIDLSNIPKDISDSILEEYHNYKPAAKSKIYPYLIDRKYDNLIDQLSSF